MKTPKIVPERMVNRSCNLKTREILRVGKKNIFLRVMVKLLKT